MEQLRNATYHAILEDPVTLQDGRFATPTYSSLAAIHRSVVLIEEPTTTGDVAGIGEHQALVLLAADTGAGGPHIYLAVVQNYDGTPEHIGLIPLGDRVEVHSIKVADHRIIVDLVEHGRTDPKCCPTKNAHREWTVQDGMLAELESPAELPAGRYRGHLVWGHESRFFEECGGQRVGWVMNETGADLRNVYDELTSAPYASLFVEVSGEWTNSPQEGFGAQFPEALHIRELHRAEGQREGWGCGLDLRGVLFLATGNEPSWRVDILESGVYFSSMNDAGKLNFPPPEEKVTPAFIRLSAENPDAAIDVSLEKHRCVDSMSGSRFEYVASVEIDGQRFRGCAIKGW